MNLRDLKHLKDHGGESTKFRNHVGLFWGPLNRLIAMVTTLGSTALTLNPRPNSCLLCASGTSPIEEEMPQIRWV